MQVILDSSVVIAYFRKNELDHKRAEEIFSKNEILIIPDVVLIEVLTIIKMKEGYERAGQVVDFLLNCEGIMIVPTDEDIFMSAIGHFISHDNHLSLVDTQLFKFAKEEQISLITFDKELAKLAAKK